MMIIDTITAIESSNMRGNIIDADDAIVGWVLRCYNCLQPANSSIFVFVPLSSFFFEQGAGREFSLVGVHTKRNPTLFRIARQ